VAQVLVVADDLTGANATAARYTATGMSAVSVTDAGAIADMMSRHDVVAASTSSRHVDPLEAARRVAEAIDIAGPVELIVKRIDTTLRGNVGSEVAAALREVKRAREGARALCVPAFPDAGRITVGGLQLVDGVAVARSPAGRDHLSPVTSSRVAEVIRQQTDLSIHEVHLDVVQADEATLVDTLHGDQHAEVVVLDATDRRDLSAIARAAARCADEFGAHWLVVDPGPFGPEYALARNPGGPGSSTSSPVPTIPPFVVIAGSVTGTTREQLVALEQVHDAVFVDVDVDALDEGQVLEDLLRAFDDAAGGAVVGVRTAASEGDVVEMDPGAAARVPQQLGAVVRSLVDQRDVGGLYLTGGDVTIGVLTALGSSGIEIDEEVLPLAVTGKVVGGPHAGVRVVTKGGLIGDGMAAVTCIDALRRRSAHDRKASR
jgi:D-threonate/D-erythronate kinase